MSIRPANTPTNTQLRSPSGRALILQHLVSVATVNASRNMDAFASRLADVLLKLSEQSLRPAEAALAFSAFNTLRRDGDLFCKNISQRLTELLKQETRNLGTGSKPASQGADMDLSLVTFEEMENKVLLGNIGQSLNQGITQELTALSLRLGWLLGRDELPAGDNPFRPELFVQAVYHGWASIDNAPDSHKIVLQLLGAELFLPLTPIVDALNDALVERGVLPDLTELFRRKRTENKVGLPGRRATEGNAARYNKVRDLLLSSKKKSAHLHGDELEDLNLPDLFSPGGTGGGWSDNTISVKVGPRLFGHLSKLQQQVDALEASGQSFEIPLTASTLRRIKEEVPEGSLTQIDENTIDLLAKIFDFLLGENELPPDMKRLFGQLQIPLLKAALIDKKFFINDDHPARVFLDRLAKSSMAWDQSQGKDDPLYKMVEQIVARVQKEFDQQMELFSDAVANLDSFLSEEENRASDVLAEPIAQALRQEKIRMAREAAEKLVATRVETGEVAGFVETFLQTQWTRILTLAYSVQDQKPEVLAKATKAMDDLLWSLTPKPSPELRKELVTRLPAILSMVNAWLNAIKWNDPARVTFFSSLAERHAMIVRIQTERSARHQVEVAVNIAEKVSQHKLAKQFRDERAVKNDRYTQMVEDLHLGDWCAFSRSNGVSAKFRLTWVSPRRTCFIFTNRQGQEPFAFTTEELAQAFREKRGEPIDMDSMVDRALASALGET